jgi:hypothetical protein
MRPIPKSSAVLISLFILAVVFIAPPATRGDEWNQMTRFTVNHPFEVPGMTLQPNTRYVIRLIDSQSNRNVVQVFNEDETKLLTMFALEIARHAKEPILAAETVNLHDLSAVKVETISPLGAETAPTATAENVPKAEVPPVEEAKPAPPVAEEQQPAPPAPPEQQRSVAENKPPEVQPPPAPPALPAQTPAPAPAPTEQPARPDLPRTAGELPLIALIGALCLGAGLGLKVLNRQF